MLKKFTGLALAPLALALALLAALLVPPSVAVTGKNIAPDFEHEYVGLIAFYDADGEFVHRCSGTLLSPRCSSPPGTASTSADAGDGRDRRLGPDLVRAGRRVALRPGDRHDPVTGYPDSGGITASTFYGFGFTGLTSVDSTPEHP